MTHTALAILFMAVGSAASSPADHHWSAISPRDEIRPQFFVESSSAAGEPTELRIAAGDQQAIDGAWVRSFQVQGDKHYRFRALRRTDGVVSPRRSAVVEIKWQDADGNPVRSGNDVARPEYPCDRTTDETGWTLVADTYQAPAKAARAVIELHLRWTDGSVRWREVHFEQVSAPERRPVRLATVHFRPRAGTSSVEKCQLFAPLIGEAAEQRADLVCLPESLTYYGTGKELAACAEPIPGPSTRCLGRIARQHDIYVVAGLTERAATVVYNTAVMIGPDGQLVGKYRKVCLPREEIAAGITPGELRQSPFSLRLEDGVRDVDSAIRLHQRLQRGELAAGHEDVEVVVV